MERMGIGFLVEERSGIRRSAYPVKVRIPSLYRRLIGTLAVAEADGRLVPSHVAETPNGLQCVFVISLAPLESRDLYLIQTDRTERVSISDPLQIESDSDGLCIRQRHASYRFGKAVQLQSVIIDSVEHLAGPFAITLDGATMTPYADEPPVRLQAPSSTLSARFAVRGAYPDLRPAQVGGMTEVEVSHGKTWVEVRHAVTNPQPNSSLVFRVPLSVPVQAQSCDFGIGNGLYGILESGSAERMVLEVDLPHANTARYRVRTQLASGELRMDYAGELTKAVDLDSRLWIHWREPAKALSLAIKRIAKGCERLTVRLGADGVAETEFLLGRTTVDPAEFEVCYHFMAADLGLAESACPASMLLPPRVSVRRNGPAGPV